MGVRSRRICQVVVFLQEDQEDTIKNKVVVQFSDIVRSRYLSRKHLTGDLEKYKERLVHHFFKLHPDKVCEFFSKSPFLLYAWLIILEWLLFWFWFFAFPWSYLYGPTNVQNLAKNYCLSSIRDSKIWTFIMSRKPCRQTMFPRYFVANGYNGQFRHCEVKKSVLAR